MANEQKTNGMATAAFVLALCGLITVGFTSLIGFVLGLVALPKLKDRGEKGEGMAITAIVIGGLAVLLYTIAIFSM